MTPLNLRAVLIGALFIGAATVIAFASQTSAPASRSHAPPPAQYAVFVDMGATASSRAAAADALLRKARARGQVRIIAGLGLTLQADDTLSAAQSAEQTIRLHAAQNAAALRAGVAPRYVTQFDTIPFVSMWVTAVQLNRLLADPSIVNIQEDVPGKAGLNKSAPFINANKVWKQNFKGNGFAIAILDTGIDKTHPMLDGGKIVSEACYSTNNAGQGISSLCPGAAGHSTAVGSGVNCPSNLDPCWHGTHVAGIAAGKAVKKNASTTLIGIAPAAKLISIQVFSAQGGAAVTFDSDWIRGLERVYALRKTYKIAAVNLSFGSGKFTGPCDTQNPAAKKIIQKLRKVRIAVIAASMNDGYDDATEEPACISEVISVGATLHTANTLATYSNNAPWVRLLAPGSGIVSAQAGGGFVAETGTSMAAAHVAGAFALMRDVYAKATVDDISAALECTGPLVTRAGLARPRIDVLAAKAYLLSPPTSTFTSNFTSEPPPGWVSVLGLWHAQSNRYQVFDNNAGYKLAVTLNCNESADITAQDLWRVGPPSNSDVQGVLFKTQVVNSNAISGYFAGYDRTGNAVIRRYDDFDLVDQTGQVTDLCNGTAVLNGDNFNNVLVSTRGGTHTLSINGTTICTATDRTYGTGFAGVLGYFGISSNMNGLAFDSFSIVPMEVVPPASARLDPG
jgi:subtilisin family serine protease